MGLWHKSEVAEHQEADTRRRFAEQWKQRKPRNQPEQEPPEPMTIDQQVDAIAHKAGLHICSRCRTPREPEAYDPRDTVCKVCRTLMDMAAEQTQAEAKRRHEDRKRYALDNPVFEDGPSLADIAARGMNVGKR